VKIKHEEMKNGIIKLIAHYLVCVALIDEVFLALGAGEHLVRVLAHERVEVRAIRPDFFDQTARS